MIVRLEYHMPEDAEDLAAAMNAPEHRDSLTGVARIVREWSKYGADAGECMIQIEEELREAKI